MFDLADFDDHESVTWISDAATGLRGVIACHSRALGPAAGGCRLWQYDTPRAGLIDALRLSRGMSYKNAMAGLPLGGGKAVIFGPLAPESREAAFEAFGRAVDALGGAYVTAEDVGVSDADMAVIARQTRHVSGLPQHGASVGGDPSPFTARGVLRGIEAAVGHALGRTDLDGVRVAVQGTGNVGGALCRMLAERGARLVIADRDPARAAEICGSTGARAVPIEAVLFQDVEVVAPCALGGVLSADSIARISAPVIAGGANNQLADPQASAVLAASGKTYAPDYVINAGGIIAVAAEYLGGQTPDMVLESVDLIGGRIADLLAQAEADGVPVDRLADRIAQTTIAAAVPRA